MLDDIPPGLPMPLGILVARLRDLIEPYIGRDWDDAVREEALAPLNRVRQGMLQSNSPYELRIEDGTADGMMGLMIHPDLKGVTIRLPLTPNSRKGRRRPKP
jgi:hypothetical protein